MLKYSTLYVKLQHRLFYDSTIDNTIKIDNTI